jgi:hypothetical protein
MNGSAFVKDLVVLTEGKNDQNAVRGILTQQRVLAIRDISADFYTHPERASGIWRHSHEFLRPFHRTHAHALVLMDRVGGGALVEQQPRTDLEQEIEQHLSGNGWRDRAAAIVIDPEIEIWVWSRVPEVDIALGWTGRRPSLWEWAVANGHLHAGESKPHRPKEAMEAALSQVRKPRSSVIYRQLAETVDFTPCTDPAFLKLRQTLGNWFTED